MRFGFHIRTSGGLAKAAEFALDSTCDCLQIFSSNPTAWHPSRFDEREGAAFAAIAGARGLYPVFLHTPYLINLATSRPDFYEKSIALLRDALFKAGRYAALGVPGTAWVVTHVGSHQGVGAEEGCRRVSAALETVLADAPAGAGLLIENNPGSGTELAHTFQEYALILAPLEAYRGIVGAALDTAHLWGAGYDISTAAGVAATLAEFRDLVGLDRLHLIHANDSVYGLGSRNDEHMHPGQGKIGIECFRALVNTRELAAVSAVQELPGESVNENRQWLAVLRDLISKNPLPVSVPARDAPPA
jgi:deoxyribonuclease-4